MVQYGVPQDMCNQSQRIGRGGRDGDSTLYLLMYEPWAAHISLEHISAEDLTIDPDRPRVTSERKHPTVQERTGVAIIRSIQSTECTRQFIASFMGDDAPNGKSSSPYHSSIFADSFVDVALAFTGFFCCDKPGCSGYDPTGLGSIVSQLLCRPLLTRVEPTKCKLAAPRNKPVQKRAAKDQYHIRNLIRTWRSNTASSHIHRAVMEPSWLINDADIKALASMNPSLIHSPIVIKNRLNETDDWYREYAFAIFDVIHGYDHPLIFSHPEPKPEDNPATTPPPKKRPRQDRHPNKENKEPSALVVPGERQLIIRVPPLCQISEFINAHKPLHSVPLSGSNG